MFNFSAIDLSIAYIGPGLGLGAVAVILGIIISISLALIGIFWYPLKKVFSRPKKSIEEDE